MRAFAVACVSASAAAAPRRAQSGAETAALVELYTSEGCSSCPPADRWLSESLPRAGVVPLALHVDYWDSIGWPDAFAQPRFGERQSRAAARAHASVYTPALVIAGRVVPERSDAPDAIRRARQAPPRAAITVEAEARASGVALRAQAVVPAAADRAHAALYVALYQSGVEVDVRAGENRGRRLRHDFVVREWLGPFPVDAAGLAAFERALDLPRGADPASLGVAAFVEDRATGDVLQALSLAL